jgi:hypothetical protein
LPQKVHILVGTNKGAFILDGDAARRSWSIRGPFCGGWPINHMVADPKSGAIYAGGGNGWYGHDVWKSTDVGRSWTKSAEGLAYEEGVAEPLAAIWSLAPRNGSLYAGVKPAGLFRSDDGGITWSHIEGLQKHPSRPEWHGGGAGLILHSIALDDKDEDQIWVGMSSVGVFHSGDGGKTWEPRNKGTRADFMPEDQRYPAYGQCVHCLVRASKSGRLYQQNHCGMYRSDDGGLSWHSIEAGLPSSFGFPAAVHPRDPETLYLLPLNGDTAGRFPPDGKAAVIARATAATSGRRSAPACRRRTPSSPCFVRQWRPTRSIPRESTSARIPARSSQATTRAIPGA